MTGDTARLVLDHVFVAVEPTAPEAEVLEQFGLVRGTGIVHQGQGTRNVRFFFENAYFELLWIHDSEEIRRAVTRPTGLWERCRWRETGVCPFGVGFRFAGDAETLPFETWLYRPEFLLPGSSIPIAANSGNLAEPLLFVVPPGRKSSDFLGDHRQLLAHRRPFRKMSGLRMTLPGTGPFSREVETIAEHGVVRFSRGTSYHLELEFDDGQQGEVRSFGEALPVSARW